jgi:N-acyl-D-aspartate/D-glutamate deacylase
MNCCCSSRAALSSLGDGGAHVNLICDVSMMPFHLSFWSRDRKRGPTLPVEKMVAKITADNAKAYGLTDRGVLAVGKRADINVMNYDLLSLTMPLMVHDLPSGGARRDQRTTGFIATVLNGTLTRENDQDTRERPRRVIRGAAA